MSRKNAVGHAWLGAGGALCLTFSVAALAAQAQTPSEFVAPEFAAHQDKVDPRALAVEIVVVAPFERAITLEQTGTIEPQESLSLAFQQSGRIIEIAADLGDHVAAGTILARLEPTQARAVKEGAGAGVTAAMAALAQAEQSFARARELRQTGGGTQASLDHAEQSWREAEAKLDEAQAQLAQAEKVLDEMVLRAPAAGQVTQRQAEIGQIVGAGVGVLTLAQNAQQEAVFDLPNVAGIDGLLGQKIELRILDGAEQALRKTVAADVIEISPLVHTPSGTVRLRLAIAPEQALPLGSSVSASFEVARGQVMAVPPTAVMRDQGRAAVWVVVPESFEVVLRFVEIARFHGDQVEITSGLTAGEWVVSTGAFRLFDGRKVRPVSGAPPSGGQAPNTGQDTGPEGGN